MRHLSRFVALLFAGLLALTACGGGDDGVEDVEKAVTAKEIEQTFIDHLSRPIESMCDAAFTHWACFYDGVEDDHGDLQVNLTTDGGLSDDQIDEMADRAGNHWFNFVGCDYPDISTVVVTVNGLDHNVFRFNNHIASNC